MKQGTGTSTNSARKTEPRSHAVNVPAVAEMGGHYIRTSSLKLYAGRGYEAPMAGTDTHPCGSQGKH